MVRYDDNSIMPGSGKYSGYKMGNIPASHLLFLLENNKCYGAVKEYIESRKEHLKLQAKYDNKMKFR